MIGATPDEVYRATLEVRTPAAEDRSYDDTPTTLIVTRQNVGRARVWITFAGSLRMTAILTDDQADQLAGMLIAAAQRSWS